MALKDALTVLAAAGPETFKERMQAVADGNAEIAALETKLGIPHTLPALNAARVHARLTKLRAQAGISVPTSQAAAVVPTIAPAAALAADDGILKTTFAEYQRMTPDHRLQFTRDGGHLAKSDFDKLSPQAKTAFCVNGGKIAEDRKYVENRNGSGGSWQ